MTALMPFALFTAILVMLLATVLSDHVFNRHLSFSFEEHLSLPRRNP